MNPVAGGIRTPDQRLRVFVSSTLKELAPERRAVRTAIEQLGLAPVMFELGARPHPPRELYRAYLAQSDIFVGLYAERYGWVAPGEEISGLEDEYRLAPPALPKLVYVKETTSPREPRLVELLGRIRDDDGASYVSFAGPEDLADLVRGDLTTLLAERFALAGAEAAGARGSAAGGAGADEGSADAGQASPGIRAEAELPTVLTALIGREHELGTVVDLLAGDARLVTLTGPGGIGKSRLAIEAAAELRERYPGGVAFVDLAPVTDPQLVPRAIADAIGVRDLGGGGLDEKLRLALRDRRMLLLLDNFEQVVDAAPALRALLADAPAVSALVTSRILLRVSGEHGVEVGPLPLPDPERAAASVERAARNPAVALFVERVRAATPDFELTADNVDDVARICVALDGVPLAIELAAARARVLTPAALLDRLDRRLPLLAGGPRDLPERQRTMRRAIEWSVQLLEPSAAELFERLGVFAGAFPLEAVEAVAVGMEDALVIDDLGELVDGSLVQQRDHGERAVFTMLAAVREFARERVDARPDERALRDRHARWYVALGEQAELELEGPKQLAWIARLSEEGDDLRAAMRHLLDTGQWEAAAHLAWTLYVYWWVDGHLGVVRGWMTELLDAGDELDDLTRATALYFTRAIGFWQNPNDWVVPGLEESADRFQQAGDRSGEALALISLALALLGAEEPDAARAGEALDRALDRFRESEDHWGEAMALVTLGRVALLQRSLDAALAWFDASLGVAARQGDELGEAIAIHHRGWAQLLLGHADAAGDRFEQSLELSARLGHDEGVAYGLEGLVAVAAAAGDVEGAGEMLGAAELLRERTGLYNAPAFSFYGPFIEPILASDAAPAFDAARRAGRRLGVAEAVERAAALRRADASGGAEASGGADASGGAKASRPAETSGARPAVPGESPA
jgi:predicted ATPase/predicted negative regulator of RcsB-dependent stress response